MTLAATIPDPPTAACPACDGAGDFAALMNRDGEGHSAPVLRCALCGGSGRVRTATMAWHARGRALRDARRLRGDSNFDLAKRLGLRTSQVSAMESGTAGPAPLEAHDA